MANPVWDSLQRGRARGMEQNALRAATREREATEARNRGIGNVLASADRPGFDRYGTASNLAFQAGDLDTGIAIRGLGQAEQQRSQQMDAQKAERVKAIAPDVVRAYQQLLGVPEGPQRLAIAQQLKGTLGPLLQQAGFDPEQMDDDLSDAGLNAELPGWTALVKPDTPAPMTDYQRARLDLQGRADDRAANAADRQAAAAERGVQQQDFSNEMGLRKEFDGISADYRDVKQMFANIQAVGGRKDSAGDLALIVAYTKILDPGSVAREGEVRLTQQTEAALQTAAMLVPRIQEGQTLLPDPVREALIGAAGDMMAQYEAAFQNRANEYRTIAQERGLNPERVVIGSGGGGTSVPPVGGEDDAAAAEAAWQAMFPGAAQ